MYPYRYLWFYFLPIEPNLELSFVQNLSFIQQDFDSCSLKNVDSDVALWFPSRRENIPDHLVTNHSLDSCQDDGSCTIRTSNEWAIEMGIEGGKTLVCTSIYHSPLGMFDVVILVLIGWLLYGWVAVYIGSNDPR